MQAILSGYLQRINNQWTWGSVFSAAVFSLPVLIIIGFVFVPANDIWRHLASTVLRDYVLNSLALTAGVGLLSLVIGIGTAWLTSMCEFSGRRWLQWALLLPLSAPAYIIGFTYSGLLEPSGPLQQLLRNSTGWEYGEYWFPEIRSLSGAVFILGLVLYPYVYLLTRSAFLAQSICVLEVSRTLGCGPWRSFFQVALPLARPAIIAGLTLVCMETLADYGTVQYLGVSTFTTGIFRTWLGLNNAAAAAQLAAVLLGFIAVLIWVERFSRSRAHYHHTSSRYSRLPRYRLHSWRNLGALAVCLMPVLLGFLIPVLQLSAWAVQTYDKNINAGFLELLWNSLWLAGFTAIAAILIALFLGYARRLQRSFPVRTSIRTVELGYAVPGTVIALGVVIFAGWFDRQLHTAIMGCCNLKFGWFISGSFLALIFAYLVRFLSVSLQSVESGLSKIKPGMDDAARVLGHGPSSILKRIHFPMIRGSVLTALILVFVDVMKELPATLVLRPFNFNTLAVRAYELAITEQLANASVSGLAIVFAGIIPVVILSRSISRARPGQTTETGIKV